MLPLETKQSGGKLLPHSDVWGGSVSRGGTTQQATVKGHVFGTWNVRSLYRAGSLLQEVGGGCEDWMELAQDGSRWRALVSTVMKFGFQTGGEFLD